jgi:hypothetical protein
MITLKAGDLVCLNKDIERDFLHRLEPSSKIFPKGTKGTFTGLFISEHHTKISVLVIITIVDVFGAENIRVDIADILPET